ncbi:MAG: hypothetical protein BGO37_06000 [Cellulomonas sp. 73-92]|uniref:hypothetical protein n=1 Tax=Cellulomonas sp. 73-92 TaxID=1895740 RepID=UPI000928D883|nr:hypothetical protein [Cellulomonas sp. 73-92]OJV81493.1 MAG: hypothetical protein BGO37_06000 [Cellulomonas sp. 73-92]
MNRTLVRQMIGADLLKLRRHRPTMAAAAALSVGTSALYMLFILARHGWHLPATQLLDDGTTLMGLYFGPMAAVLVGTQAGVTDLANHVFRDLAATGRSRVLLFLTRVPAAVLLALLFTLAGFAVSTAAAYAFHGAGPGPDLALVLRSGAWVALATAVLTTLAVGVGSLTGSASITLVAVIGWQTIVTGILYIAGFLGNLRWAVLSIALSRFLPAAQIGTRAHPGSSNALVNYKVPMPAAVAALVIVAWVLVPSVLGAWRTAHRDV